MIAALLFVVQHAAALAILLAVSAAAGTALLGSRGPLALRSILGLALVGQLLVVLGTIGLIRPWTIAAVALLALAAGAARMEWHRPRWPAVAAVGGMALPLFALALFPPLAFDETLYHLPFVRAIAESGAIRFLPDLRFPLFPELHEVLCVPGYLALGDVAPHLVAVAEVVLLAALLAAWLPGRAGFVAAALLLGNPIVVHLATVTYVEAALMLFVAAGFFCLERAGLENESWAVPLAGFLFGTACSVKYLGWYFAAAALAWVAFSGSHRRGEIVRFTLGLLAGLAPMEARILALTGNPFFPFLHGLFGPSDWMIPPEHAGNPWLRTFRLLWDVTFARERVNRQPPYSPFVAVACLITFLAARRDRRAAFLLLLCAGYTALFILFMPADSRYLLPLLPLVLLAAAQWIAPRRRLAAATTLLSVAAGVAYVVYRFTVLGPPPLDAARRRQFLEQRIPEYRALQRRGAGRVYVCGAEQLQYYGHGELLGDTLGPLSNDRFLRGHDAAELSRMLAPRGVRFVLVSRRVCPPEWQRVPAPPVFELVYSDDGAVLWRLDGAWPVDR